MYVNARLASAAHDKEMQEATARIQAQRELAAAQAQAAQRALTVAREKAAHEAKSEVRPPCQQQLLPMRSTYVRAVRLHACMPATKAQLSSVQQRAQSSTLLSPAACRALLAALPACTHAWR